MNTYEQIEYWASLINESEGIEKSSTEIKDIDIDNNNKDKTFNDIMTTLSDDNYEGFVDELKKMANGDKDPKIKKLREIFCDKFEDYAKNNYNISYGDKTINVDKCHPTQNEIDMTKSLYYPLTDLECIKQCVEGKNVPVAGKRILVTEINNQIYIIDGHHRWSQLFVVNPEATIQARVIKGMFDNPDQVLKFAQSMILAKTNDIQIAGADEGSNLLDKSLDEKIKKYIRQTVEPHHEILKALDKLDYITQPNSTLLANKLMENIQLMRTDKNVGKTGTAHERPVMPQTGDVEEFNESEESNKNGYYFVEKFNQLDKDEQNHVLRVLKRCLDRKELEYQFKFWDDNNDITSFKNAEMFIKEFVK